MSSPASARPSIFVSSTIYDFRDLRSALKFWLEELGYDVQMSDHADFNKPLDTNSYEACLRSIETCDYFVLLIGSRVGGPFSTPENVSITRAEYRHAYKLFQQGRIKLVPFVRREVWNIREDRKALKDYLRGDFRKAKELGDAEVDAISKHESKFVTDAEAIFSFIDEVARADEMRAAVKTGSGYPAGNWIHVFDTFEEIAGALRSALGSTANLRRRALEACVRDEILRNLRSVVGNKPNTLSDHVHVAFALAKNIGSARDFGGSTILQAVDINTMWMGLISIPSYETTFLEEALRSGEFMDYDKARDRFHVGTTQRVLIQLRRALQAVNQTDYTSLRNSLTENHYVESGPGDRSVTVKNAHLLPLVLGYHTFESAVHLLIKAHRVLSGKAAPPSIQPPLPKAMLNIPLKNLPSLEQVEAWIDGFTDFA